MLQSKQDHRQHQERRPRLALIAHDSQRDHLVALLWEFLPTVRQCHLVATYVTGTVCARQLDLPVDLVASSVNGGDQQLASLVVAGKLDAVIFFRDPIASPLYDPALATLQRACDIHNVPLATNQATARAILMGVAASQELVKKGGEDETKDPSASSQGPSGQVPFSATAPPQLAQTSHTTVRAGDQPIPLPLLLGEVGTD